MIANIYKVMSHKITCHISFNELYNTDNCGAHAVKITALCLSSKDDSNLLKIDHFNKTHFDMSKRDGDYKAAVIRCCLENNSLMRRINISNHCIICRGVRHIADALTLNKSLKSLIYHKTTFLMKG